MPIDLDPMDFLDTNYDMEITSHDLQTHELQEYGTYSIDDLDHDGILDQFDVDIGNDNLIDQYQVDINHNNLIDQYEHDFGITKWKYDTNQDNSIDYIDRALGQQIYGF
ncbi:hypothetical protein [Pseudalkalibacillus caeni]|uniref:Uncharacterized protein n=1 Tax=Exobacillus caeni TaxID=2574798 RepID=A0A5R9F7W2_9BACL|nr:hypothetical protein [Pseudalkalibacillus caeni]TLS38609.1 hypothetical protein FCL54_03670 [Pseudalkalibacillus caeni]